MNSLDLGEEVAELAVVDLDSVIEIDVDAAVGVVAELFVEGEQFNLLLFEFVSLFFESFAVSGGGGGLDDTGGAVGGLCGADGGDDSSGVGQGRTRAVNDFSRTSAETLTGRALARFASVCGVSTSWISAAIAAVRPR